MMPFNRFIAVCAVSFGILTGQLQAALISSNDASFGVGSITQDTATGLEWLDVTLSVNLSYNTVSGQFGAGGQFEGFRYGTQAEVDQLFRNAGFAQTDGVFRTADYSTAQAFMSFVGVTSSSARGDDALGVTADLIGTLNGTGLRRMFIVSFEFPPFQNPSAGYAVGLDSPGSSNILDSNAANFRGSWLVRESAAAVPEPASFAIWSLATVAFVVGGIRRRVVRTTVA
jgi:hypothetical protein